jgi:hypothetical protein
MSRIAAGKAERRALIVSLVAGAAAQSEGRQEGTPSLRPLLDADEAARSCRADRGDAQHALP